jgi:transposase
MEHFIGWDAHKQYSVFVAIDEKGQFSPTWRTSHEGGEVERCLEALPAGSRIAIEATGTCYWLIEEMRARGHQPVLAHPLESKKRMGQTKKTDRLDARGLAMLLRNGTLPEVWIPPAEIRDQREPMRLRMALTRKRTQLKNRIHGVLSRFNVQIPVSDLFGKKGREQLEPELNRLPEHTRASVKQALRVLDFLELEIGEAEKRIAGMLEGDEAVRLLDSLPCVGPILSAVMALEIGRIERFQTAEQLASYAGLVPSVHSSGGHTRIGRVGHNVNRTLKWAFVEAANLIAMQRRKHPDSHAVRLYQRVRDRKNHQKATVAVARHLAEAAFVVLRKKQIYRSPADRRSSKRSASLTHE